MRKQLMLGLMAALALQESLHALAADTAAAQLDKLKALAGDWVSSGEQQVGVNYRVTAAGTAVVETVFVGSPHEMVTVYTVEKGDLVLTHYCAKGNQPHMKAVRGNDANTIAFKFVDLGNGKASKDGHMHEATFAFKDADHFSSSWQFYEGGKPTEKAELNLVRKTS